MAVPRIAAGKAHAEIVVTDANDREASSFSASRSPDSSPG